MSVNFVFTGEEERMNFKCALHCLGQGAVTVSGKVETGYVQNGDRVVVMPAGEAGIVKGK